MSDQKRHRTTAMDDNLCPGCGGPLKRRLLGMGLYQHKSGEWECPNSKCAIIKVHYKNGKKMIARACDVR